MEERKCRPLARDSGGGGVGCRCLQELRDGGMGGWGDGMDRIEVMIWLVFSFSDVCLCLDVERKRKVPVLQ